MQSGYGLTRESGEQRTQSVRYQQHRRLPGLLLLACTVRQGLVHAFVQSRFDRRAAALERVLPALFPRPIGRASFRECACQSVLLPVVAVSLINNNITLTSNLSHT